MVTCEICGKEFKNTQGLRGHKNFKHNEHSLSNTPDTEEASPQQVSNLKDRLDKLEYVTGLREPSTLDRFLYDEKPLSNQLAEVTEQLGSVTQQLTTLVSNTLSDTEFKEIKEQVTHLTQELSKCSKWFQPVKTILGTQSRLENELSNRAQNTRVNTIEGRLTQLENSQEQQERNFNENIASTIDSFDTQINDILMIIGRLVDQVSTITERLQSVK